MKAVLRAKNLALILVFAISATCDTLAWAADIPTREFVVGPGSEESKGFTDVHDAGDYEVTFKAAQGYRIIEAKSGEKWESRDMATMIVGPPDPKFWLSISKPKEGLSVKFTGKLVPIGSGPGNGTPPVYDFEGNVVQIRLRFDVNGDEDFTPDDDSDPDDDSKPGLYLGGASTLTVQVNLQGKVDEVTRLATDGREIRFIPSSPNLLLKDNAGQIMTTIPAFEGTRQFQVKIADGTPEEPRDSGQSVTGKMTIKAEIGRLVPPPTTPPPPTPAPPTWIAQTADTVKVNGVQLELDPVSLESVIKASDEANFIRNPAGIVIESRPTEKNVAIIEITKVEPADINLANDDERLIWAIKPVAGEDGGGEASFFSPNGGNPDNTGKRVRLYGTKEGRILLTATFRGNKEPAESHEAWVVKERTVPFRVQIFIGETSTRAKPIGTNVTAEQAAEQIVVANIHLRQVGVRLVADQDTTIDPNQRINAIPRVNPFYYVRDRLPTDPPEFRNGPPRIEKVPGMPGYFICTVMDEYTKGLLNTSSIVLVNDRNNVTQIMFIENLLGAAPTQGLNAGRAINGNDSPITSTYRVVLEKKAESHTMRLLGPLAPALGSQRPPPPSLYGPYTWGFVNTNFNGDPSKPLGVQTYGKCIAHELGHVFQLGHRAERVTGLPSDFSDGLMLPSPIADRANLMSPDSKERPAQDLDIIQLKAIIKSKAIP